MPPEDVMPLVVDRAGLRSLEAQGPVASTPLGGELHVLFVADRSGSMDFLGPDEAAELGDTAVERLTVAWQNLARDLRIELHGQGGVVQMLTCDGTYEASLLLYTDFWLKQREIWIDGGDPVVIMPARDLLIFSWSKIRQGIGKLAITLDDCRADPELRNPLEGGPLRFTGTGWVPYEAGPDEVPFVPWEPPPPQLVEPSLPQTVAAGMAQALLFAMWAPLGWRFVEIVGLGGGKPFILACMLPTMAHWVAWRWSETHPWHRPRLRGVQLVSVLWASFCLGLMCIHLGVWEPPKAWWAWPTALLATGAVAVEAFRLARGDGYQWTETLTPDQLRALKNAPEGSD